MDLIIACLSVGFLWSCYSWFVGSKVKARRLPYPPGPKPLPVIGNLRDLSGTDPFLKAVEWGKTYGDVVYLNAFGTHILYVNSLSAANELLEKRSTIYSGRPKLVMFHEILGFSWTFALLPYGPQWRKQRKSFHQSFSLNAIESYQRSQLSETRKLLQNLFSTPDNFLQHVRSCVSTTILRVTYGIEGNDTHDDYISKAEEAMTIMAAGLTPGRFWVDTVPALKYLPEWFPGAGFKRQGRIWGSKVSSIKDRLFAISRNALDSGHPVPCASTTMLLSVQGENQSKEEEELMRGSALTGYISGTDTTVSTVQFFFLAMALHPKIQAKAQAQLDSILGQDRLPVFSDRSQLPYIEAIIMECLRWHPSIPLGVPHCLDEDDEYNGHFVPKGTIVFSNIWAILHDKEVYSDPSSFFPERFLDANGQIDPMVPHPDVACFGFGRRVCPGQHLASNAIFIIIASVISAFEISPAYDEEGAEIPIRDEVLNEMLTFPKPFECTIKPRSEAIAKLIRQGDMFL